MCSILVIILLFDFSINNVKVLIPNNEPYNEMSRCIEYSIPQTKQIREAMDSMIIFLLFFPGVWGSSPKMGAGGVVSDSLMKDLLYVFQ